MFAFQVFAWNVLVLILIACELYVMIEEDLVNLLRTRGFTGHLQETLHHAVVVESWSPEVVEMRPNTGGIETSAFAGAVPWMALMAGALALLLAVYWKPKLIACDDLDHEEDDLEVPNLDIILESSEEEEEEERLLETEELYSTEEEEEEEEKSFGTEELYSSEEEEEEIFGTEDLDSTEEEEEEEGIFETEKLDSSDKQEEKETSAKELEISQVHRGLKLERLLDEAKKEIAWLQNQILEKDLLLEKKAAEGTELIRKIEHLNIEKEQMQAEKRKFEDGCKLALDRADVMEKLQKELMNNIVSLQNQLEEKDHLLRKRDDEAEKDQLQLGVLESQILDMKEDHMALQQQLVLTEENFAIAERKLICEKQDLEAKLQVAFSHGKELERERSEMRVHYQERLKEKDNEKEMLREWERQLQDNLESAVHQQEKLERSLKHAEGEICSLKKAESIKLRELEQLRKECERLQEKCRMLEENTIKQRKHFREHLRTQEEELKNQDKYMLMTLLHGTAQRNFHLEHIALDCRNKSLDNNSKEELPDNCVETTDGRKDQGQEEDLLVQVQKLEEEQFRMYRNAQREKDDYGKQWEVLTQIVEDLIQGDEQKNS